MFKWWKQFFAVDNAVNEDTVLGVLFSVVLIVGIFVRVSDEATYVLASLVAAFFGLGALKK